jgi:hypothetical protein
LTAIGASMIGLIILWPRLPALLESFGSRSRLDRETPWIGWPSGFAKMAFESFMEHLGHSSRTMYSKARKTSVSSLMSV